MWRKRIRYSFLVATELLKRYYRIFIISAVLGASFFWIAPRIWYQLPHSRQVVRIGVVGQYDENNLPYFIVEKLSRGLTQIDNQGQAFPGLASSWEAKEKGKSWIFNLDSRLKWSDGSQIQAKDIQTPFQDTQIEILSDTSIKFILPDEFAPFPVALSNPIYKDNRLGIGPYKRIRSQRQGPYFQLLEFEPITKESGKPRLRYRFYPTQEAAKLGFKLGEIDEIAQLTDISGFDNWPNVNITKNTQYNRYVGLFFNLSQANFQQKTVRQGLSYAIKDKTFGYERALTSIPATSWAHNAQAKPYDYDKDRAIKFLSEDKSPEGMKITLTTINSLLPVAEQIAHDWLEVGVHSEIQIVNVIPETFDVLLIPQVIPADPDQYAYWHSTQNGNIIKYQNPKIDKLLEDGRRTIDQATRKQIYLEFQKTINEDVPAVFLYHPVNYTLKRI